MLRLFYINDGYLMLDGDATRPADSKYPTAMTVDSA
jgi:hypothetical protein